MILAPGRGRGEGVRRAGREIPLVHAELSMKGKETPTATQAA